MNNILKSPSLWLFIFLCFLLTGCFEEDTPDVPYNPDASKHVNVNETNDAQLYNNQAGVYDLTLNLLTDSFSYETGEYVYDKIAKSEVEFGDSNDRMARFKIPVKIFGYIVANEETRNSLLNSNEQILIETPYTIRLWDFSEYNINLTPPKETIYDCKFNTGVNGFAFDIGDKQYVLSIRIAYMERSWSGNKYDIKYPDVIDGIGFYYVKLLCNEQEVPLAYKGQQLDGAYPFKFVGNWLGEHHPFSVLKK